MKGLTTRERDDKIWCVSICRHKKGFNFMGIAITSNSKRDTLVKGLVCGGIKYL